MSFLITPAPQVFNPRKAPTLYDKPASPSSYDDEFESSSMDPKWTVVTTSGSFDSVNDIDAYAGFSSGHRTSHNNYRKSWWMVQPASSGGVYAYQSVSLPSECFIWARTSFNFRYSAQVAEDANHGLLLGQLSSGLPSTTNCVWCYTNRCTTNAVRAEGGNIVSSVTTSGFSGDVGAQTAGTDCLCQPFEFVGIQKISTTFHCFAGTGAGNWLLLKTVTYSGTIDTLTLSANCSSTASPGNMIMGFDFVRMYTGRMLP